MVVEVALFMKKSRFAQTPLFEDYLCTDPDYPTDSYAKNVPLSLIIFGNRSDN